MFTHRPAVATVLADIDDPSVVNWSGLQWSVFFPIAVLGASLAIWLLSTVIADLFSDRGSDNMTVLRFAGGSLCGWLFWYGLPAVLCHATDGVTALSRREQLLHQ